jgi:hypothetical protein
MGIRHEEIIATVDSSAFKLDPSQLAVEAPVTLDNLYLDAYGLAIDAIHNHAICVESVSMVYAAAKVMFARHGEGKRPILTFDLATAAAMGSPWEHQCSSAEEWAVCFARRHVETDEGIVDDDAVDADCVSRAFYALSVLNDAGVPRTDAALAQLCHDNETLIASLNATPA